MSFVFYAFILAGALLSMVRPGLLAAVALNSYNFECYLGGNPMIGAVLSVAIPAFAAISAFRHRAFSFHSVDAAMLAFSLIYLLIGIRAFDQGAAFADMTKFVIIGPGLYFAARMFFFDEETAKRFAWDFAIGFVVLNILFGMVATPNEWGTRAAIGHCHPVGFASTINAALSMPLFLLAAIRPPRSRLLQLLGYPLLAVAILALMDTAVVNGSRGALLVPIAAFLLFLTYMIWVRFDGAWRLVFIGGALILALALPLIMAGVADMVAMIPDETLPSRQKIIILNFANALSGQGQEIADASVISRQEIYRQTWNLITNAPLLGNGLDSTSRKLLGAYAHNIFLELWAQGGIAAMAVFSVLVISPILFSLRLVRSRQLGEATAIFLGVALGSFVQLQVSSTLLFSKNLFFAIGTLVGFELLRLRRVEQARLAALAAPPPRDVPMTPAHASTSSRS